MKEKMLFAGVNVGRRYTLKEKELFLQHALSFINQHGLKYTFQTRKSAFMNVCNLVVGDLKEANTVVACSYTTPAKSTYPLLKYYPFNPKLNIKDETINLILQLVGAICCVIVILIWLKWFASYSLWLKILVAVASIVFGYKCFRFIRPSGNQVNFSRSSAAVAAVLKLIETVKNPRIAYVFLDQNCNSYEGVKLLKEHLRENQNFIYLDNLASGSKTVIAHSKGLDVSNLLSEHWIDKEYDETDNILGYFKKATMITCGDILNKQFVVRNTGTKHDHVVDMDRLNTIVNKCIILLEEKV